MSKPAITYSPLLLFLLSPPHQHIAHLQPFIILALRELLVADPTIWQGVIAANVPSRCIVQYILLPLSLSCH